jgi:hypothetical protein
MKTPTLFLLMLAALALSASAFQQQIPARRSVVPTTSRTARAPLWMSAHFANSDDAASTTAEGSVSFPRMVRNRLRQATGFSFTVFRATLRGITGISLTTVYAGALAATGLWVRRTMSALLSIFPSWFRYFLQPFLVLYYTPLIILRSLTSPTTRKRAIAKHETVVGAWKEAVTLAEQTEKSGYWPVVVSNDGYFELNKPPRVGETNTNLAEAMAEAVEHAMEINDEEATK